MPSRLLLDENLSERLLPAIDHLFFLDPSMFAGWVGREPQTPTSGISRSMVDLCCSLATRILSG